jgi:hypothetical protein
LLAKLQRYEDHLRKLGVDVEEGKKGRSASAGGSQDEDEEEEEGEHEEEEERETREAEREKEVKTEPGTLMLDSSGKSRYFEKYAFNGHGT